MTAKNKSSRPTVRTRRTRSNRTTAKGREIVASLNEAVEVQRAGLPVKSRFTVRTVEVPDEPAQYDARAVRSTRDSIGVSQTVFAHLLGISPTLVRAWEQSQ